MSLTDWFREYAHALRIYIEFRSFLNVLLYSVVLYINLLVGIQEQGHCAHIAKN